MNQCKHCVPLNVITCHITIFLTHNIHFLVSFIVCELTMKLYFVKLLIINLYSIITEMNIKTLLSDFPIGRSAMHIFPNQNTL